MFFLEPSGTYADIFCPNCNGGYDIDWQTEYGIPISGAHKIECPDCGHEYTMRVSTHVLYAVEDKGG